jgi:hypothetical protein
MGIKQFQRGMRHRFKYLQLRLRLQARHLVRHAKVRKVSAPPCIEADQPQTEAEPFQASPGPSAPYPTLRRSGSRKTTQ